MTSKNILKVALLQISPHATARENMEKGHKYCRIAKDMGADIALFPEMWSSGYVIPENPKDLESIPVSADGEFVRSFRNLASDLNMAISITFLEKTTTLPKNTLLLFDRHGSAALKYSKVHTCDFGDEIRLTPGDDFYVCDLDTENGIVKVGAMICFDREFPESARILMLKGAEIILVPNACPMEINRLSQLRGRAYENMVGIATCNYPANVPDCNGHSSAFDGVAYLPELTGSRDTCICGADEGEGVFIAEFDMDMIRSYREHEVHGNAYRHPSKYGMLTDESVSAPFIRKNSRR